MENNLYEHLIVLMMKARRQLSKLCEQRELTPVQGILLILLDPNETKTMNELSEIMGCDASNITGLVDRLESHGLIERIADEQDRRVKIIKLSEKGHKCRDYLLEGLQKASAIDFAALISEETQQFQKTLTKLLK